MLHFQATTWKYSWLVSGIHGAVVLTSRTPRVRRTKTLKPGRLGAPPIAELVWCFAGTSRVRCCSTGTKLTVDSAQGGVWNALLEPPRYFIQRRLSPVVTPVNQSTHSLLYCICHRCKWSSFGSPFLQGIYEANRREIMLRLETSSACNNRLNTTANKLLSSAASLHLNTCDTSLVWTSKSWSFEANYSILHASPSRRLSYMYLFMY